MRIGLITFILSALVACSGGGRDSHEPESIDSVFVLGDSLCSPPDTWPEILGAASGIQVDKFCFAGMGVVKSHPYTLGKVPMPEEVAKLNHGYDMFIMSLGVNDALMGSDLVEFEQKYQALVNTHRNTVCLLPPLTSTNVKVLVEAIRQIIIDVCPNFVYPEPSDHEDGIHYTAIAQKLNAARLEALLEGG